MYAFHIAFPKHFRVCNDCKSYEIGTLHGCNFMGHSTAMRED